MEGELGVSGLPVCYQDKPGVKVGNPTLVLVQFVRVQFPGLSVLSPLQRSPSRVREDEGSGESFLRGE